MQLGELIATGSFGVVHSGMYRGQHVAIKFLLFAETSSEEELNRAKRGFRQEVAVWHKLQHPNVVQVRHTQPHASLVCTVLVLTGLNRLVRLDPAST